MLDINAGQDLQLHTINLAIGAYIIILTRISALLSAPKEELKNFFLNCTFQFYNCTNCDQLHAKICPA